MISQASQQASQQASKQASCVAVVPEGLPAWTKTAQHPVGFLEVKQRVLE